LPAHRGSVSLVNQRKNSRRLLSRARDEEMLFPVIEVRDPFGGCRGFPFWSLHATDLSLPVYAASAQK
jgi:hypothetical protein